jgi:Lon protease-like protein
MPCAITKEEELFYEREANAKKFAKAASDAEILEEVACMACRELAKAGRLGKAPELVQRWARLHRIKDEKAGRKWPRKSTKQSTK